VGETDEAFADVYSAAVSSQNLNERISQRGAILGVAGAGVVLAVWLGLRPSVAVGNYESFLFLLGSVFVPLFGMFVSDYFVFRPRRDPAVGRASSVAAVAAWVVGFVVYQWSVPTGPAAWQSAVRTVLHGWLHLPFPLANSAAGASIPAFVTAFVAHAALSWRTEFARRKRGAALSR
jgi:purine-cytosine permease-like protein